LSLLFKEKEFERSKQDNSLEIESLHILRKENIKLKEDLDLKIKTLENLVNNNIKCA